jgi:hypothetical protein
MCQKGKVSTCGIGVPYVISTPGGRVDANRIAQNVPLELSGRVFNTNLIILSGQGIDIILWMNWIV